jgi:hypothetical protein
MMSTLSLAALWIAAPAMTLESDSACPSAEAVHAALEGLGIGEQAPAAAVKVRAEAAGLVVVLAWPDSPQAQYRNLAVDGDCAARARAAAVVVAAWLGSLPTTSLAAPVVEPVKAPVAGRPSASPPAEGARWLLGLGIGAGASGDLDLAPAFLVEATRRVSSRVGLALAASATGPRQRTVGPGTSHFVRPALALMGRMLLPVGRAQLGFDAGLAGGLAVAWGTGYPSNDTRHAFDWGPAGGLRLLSGSGRFRPWLAVHLMVWLRSQSLRYEDLTTGKATATTVSSVEGSIAAGFDFEVM